MKNKTYWTQRKSTKKNIIVGLWVAIIFLIIEAIRFFVTTIIKPTTSLEMLTFMIPWGVAIIVVTLIMVGFMNSLEKNKLKDN